MKIRIYFILTILLFGNSILYAGDPWADFFGTSSTAGTWNSGIRSDTTTTIQPPLVKRWEKYEWAGSGVNVVPDLNEAVIYNGFVYFGQGNMDTSSSGVYNDPGFIWAWDIATGVTKTGFPIGPLDSGVISFSMAIANNKLYALTAHQLYGWDISGTPALISGFPVSITETTDGGTNTTIPMYGVIFWNDKLYFCTERQFAYPSVPLYLYAKDANNGSEIFRKQILPDGGTIPCIWNGRVYVAGEISQQVYCWDANTGANCANFPVNVAGEMRTSPIIQDGVIYIGTGGGGGNFYAIDAMGGNILWTYNAADVIVSTAAIWQDKVYFGTNTNNLYGLYRNTGALVPGFPTGGYTYGTDGPISTANGMVYSNNGGWSFAVDANNGANLIWQSPDLVWHGGGISYAYNYPSITIGSNEIVSVYPANNQIVVYGMPSATPTITLTHTISPTFSITETATETITGTPPTATNTLTSTITLTPTNTPIPANLFCSLNSFPDSVCIGAAITVIMSVSNTGESTANNTAPSVLLVTGTSPVVKMAGPWPLSVTITGGTNESFTWIYATMMVGSVNFSGSASGIDSSSGVTVTSVGCSDSVNITICTPTDTQTTTPSDTPSPTLTQSETEIESETITPTATITSTLSETATKTTTPTISPTPSESETETPTPTQTSTQTLTPTLTLSITLSKTVTQTPSITTTATVLPCSSDESDILSYPNPYKSVDGFTLRLGLCFISNVHVKIYTNSFRKIMDKTYSGIPAGQNLKIISDNDNKQASGIYYAVVTITPPAGSGYVIMRKVLILVIIN